MRGRAAVRLGVFVAVLPLVAAVAVRGTGGGGSAVASEPPQSARRSRADRRTATLHWIHAVGSRTEWNRVSLNRHGVAVGEPTTVELRDANERTVAPADIAVSRRGDVVITLPLDYEVRIYGPGADMLKQVLLDGVDQPHGVAVDRAGDTAYVVARTPGPTGANLYAIPLGDPPDCVDPIAMWPTLENATGLEIHRGVLYVACSGLDGDPGMSDTVVASCRIETPGDIRPFVTGARQAYGVAVDPRRRFLHFTVSGEQSVFTVPLSDQVADIPELGTLNLPGTTAGASYDGIHRRILVGLGTDTTETWTGVHAGRILGPRLATGPEQLLMTAPVRAVCVGR